MVTSTPAERVRAARERAGLDMGEVASRLGLSFAHLRDLESFEDDVENTISIETLRNLSLALGVTVLFILEGADPDVPAPRISFSEFAARVSEAVRRAGGDVDAWGEDAGWDVRPLLDDPETVWKLDVDALRDIAGAAGVDWHSVLPE